MRPPDPVTTVLLESLREERRSGAGRSELKARMAGLLLARGIVLCLSIVAYFAMGPTPAFATLAVLMFFL